MKKIIVILSTVLFPLQLWAYGAIKVDHSGRPLKHPSPTTLTWNPEHGPMMTDEAAHPFRSLADVDAICGGHAARASDSAPGAGGGGGGGGGGCSMNPLIREAWAQTIDPIGFTNDAWAQWNNVTEANVHVTQGSFLQDGDVTVCSADRYAEVLSPYSDVNDPRICGCITPRPAGCNSTCVNPVLFDPNGDILVARYDGDESIRTTLLAEAGPDFYFTNPATQEGSAIRFTAIINGACLVGSALPACTRTYTAEQLKGVLTHELGHALGLDHSQTNKAAVSFNSADGTYNLVGGNAEAVPTMYPFLVRGANQATLHRDDKMGLAHLYPKSDFASTHCRAEGVVYNNAASPLGGLACGEVVLRDTTDPTNEALSFISGAEVPNNYDVRASAAGCQASGTGCGNFVVEGLLPRHSYTVELRTVASGISGSSSMINPCVNPRTDFSEIAPNPGSTIYCGAGGAVIQCSSAAPGSPLCVQGRTR